MARLLALVCALVVSLVAASASAADYARGKSPARAAALVDAALEAELAGDAAKRGELLSRAIDADGDYAPARWQRGQVKFEGKWRTPAEVGKLVSQDRRWKEYLNRREAASSLADHVELARWCLREGLTHEERFHWALVLLTDPSHEQARKRLSLREYRGGLYTHEQVAEHQRRLEESEANLAKWKPKFRALCRRASRGDEAHRAAAIEELRNVADPAAIDALEYVVHRESRKAPDALALQLKLALVVAIANVPEHEATLKLLDYSLFAAEDQVRRQAAYALKSRPATDWVPLLMGALKAPIEGQIGAFTSPDGTVCYGENLAQAGPEADVAVVRSHTHTAVLLANERGETSSLAVAHEAWAAEFKAQRARARVAQANAEAEVRNLRVREVLRNTLNMDLGSDPKAYWQAWIDYNDLYYDDHPTYTYEDVTASWSYVEPPSTHSCFMSGTPVWTLSGPKPIEHVALGDMVLAQQPDTGELAYRPVMEKTVGPPTQTLELSVAGETLVATPGHRFWINGRGWEMAKSLSSSMQLHALETAVEVASIKKGERLECHNLVVDEFHTFFVGESRILVHDKTCPQPTVAATPGLRRRAGRPLMDPIIELSGDSTASLPFVAASP